MYRTVAMLLMLALSMILGQEPIAQRSTILVNTVKRGDLVQMVRGLGVFKAERTAEVTSLRPRLEQSRRDRKRWLTPATGS